MAYKNNYCIAKILILIIMCSFIIDARSKSFEIKLRRWKSPRLQLIEMDRNMRIAVWKDIQENESYYSDPSKPKPPPGPKDNDTIAIYKFLDTEFYAEVGIGHPVKYFKLVVDTAWAETWVASKQCGLKCVGCWNLNKYDSLASSTFQENGKEFSFGSGKEAITGFFSIESFYIGHINVKNQTFGEVTCLPWHYLFSKADGVLGLAFSSLSIGNIMPIFYNMVYQQLIKKPIFSIYMNRDPTTNHAGSIMIGASNPKHYNGSWTYTSVTQKKYWQFNIDNIYLDLGTKSYSLCDSTCPSIIDSSTSIISGPSKIIKRINSLMSATELLMGYYQVDCGKVTKLPHVRFLIAGRNFTLHGKELAQKMEMKGVSACLSVFASTEFADQNNLWTLGSAFLAQYYTLYDINASKIGFATAT
ncbi:lysosomal aspartic protease-like [Ctenocephalides felis]|uniref:lysosomal aspartic protease-like n=1 Tax=Ctenocephalides felis TaxID=7515 RepID=UPI000E6E1CB7|nr:lysosomal aspartic protease-like [Ctenocephalides felis]